MSAKSKYNRVCAVCGKEYRYCNTCRDFSHLPLWMNRYCSFACKDGFRVAADYSHDVITREEAVSRLGKLDLSNLKNFRSDVKDIIEVLLKKDEKPPVVVSPKKPSAKKMAKRNTVDKDITAKVSEVSDN